MAISGDTLVVGAPGETYKLRDGAAMVFVRDAAGKWSHQASFHVRDLIVGAETFYDPGVAVAIDGDTAVVGVVFGTADTYAPGNAFVFTRQAGKWTQQAKLVASDAAQGALFGHALAIQGDTVVVGAPLADVKNLADVGKAYVFSRKGKIWSQQAKLMAQDQAESDGFGWSVALHKATAVVGTPYDDDKGSSSGSAYVYSRSGATWSLQKKLVPGDGGTGHYFGKAVAVHGDTMAAGAWHHDANGKPSGAAYLYTRVGTAWTQQTKLTATGTAPKDAFGNAVALHQNTLVVGAPYDDTKGTDAGAAHVFVRSGTSWTHQVKLTAKDAAAGDRGGWAVAVDNDTVVLGADWHDHQGADAGAALAFVRVGSAWSQRAELLPPKAPKYLGTQNGQFGVVAAMDNNTLAVGASTSRVGSYGLGAVYVYVNQGTGWAWQARLLANNHTNLHFFGASVGVSSDTVVVGVPGDGSKGSFAGAAYVFVRKGSAWAQQAKITAADGAAGDWLGFAIAVSGDTLAVGAVQDDDVGQSSGSVYVFVRKGSTWSQQTKLVAAKGAKNFYFGEAVALQGDTLAVGESLSGLVHVYVRQGNTWTLQTKIPSSLSSSTGYFGESLSLDGDTLAVSAKGESTVVVFTRQGSSWTQQAMIYPQPTSGPGSLGRSVALYKDTLVIGGETRYTMGINSGAAYIYTRSGTVWTERAELTASDVAAGDGWGQSVAVGEQQALMFSQRHTHKTTASGAGFAFTWKGKPGFPCTKATQCAAGFCVDGVCCDTACGGGAKTDCHGCSLLAGAAKNGTCGPVKQGVICRANQGACDKAEACDGKATSCPKDVFKSAATICRPAMGSCDKAEACTGSSHACPINAFKPLGTKCRPSVGRCDLAEVCDGKGACPKDTVKPAGAACRPAAGACDVAEACAGSTALCPKDVLSPAGTTCRAATGECDKSEQCDGASLACPGDLFQPNGATCNKGQGSCTGGKCDPLPDTGMPDMDATVSVDSQPDMAADSQASPDLDGVDVGIAPAPADDGCSCHLSRSRSVPAATWLALSLLCWRIRRRRIW